MRYGRRVVPPGTADERALVLALRTGDGRAFDEVYARHRAPLFSFLYRLSGRRDTAEDLAQETWVKLARNASRLRDDTNLRAYLFTVARNAFVSHRRWAMLDLSRLVTFGVELLAEARVDPGPEVDLERAERRHQVEAALLALPVASREILLLVGVDGLGQDAIATMLGITPEALRQRLHRARTQLADALDREASRRGSRMQTKGSP